MKKIKIVMQKNAHHDFSILLLILSFSLLSVISFLIPPSCSSFYIEDIIIQSQDSATDDSYQSEKKNEYFLKSYKKAFLSYIDIAASFIVIYLILHTTLYGYKNQLNYRYVFASGIAPPAIKIRT